MTMLVRRVVRQLQHVAARWPCFIGTHQGLFISTSLSMYVTVRPHLRYQPAVYTAVARHKHYLQT
jgi:hypothetical protein